MTINAVNTPVATSTVEQPAKTTKAISCPNWIMSIFNTLSTVFSYISCPFKWMASKFFSNSTSVKTDDVASKTLLQTEKPADAPPNLTNDVE